MKMVSEVQEQLSTTANSTVTNKLLWRDILQHIKLGPAELKLQGNEFSYTCEIECQMKTITL